MRPLLEPFPEPLALPLVVDCPLSYTSFGGPLGGKSARDLLQERPYLKEAGYATGCVGKWHNVAKPGPYDEYREWAEAIRPGIGN